MLIICLILLPALLHAASLPQTNLDPSPRAALLSLAGEQELAGILRSIEQLEESFNSRYLYHWVFFSPVPLSENFRRLTSNATNATCIYEHVPDAASALEPRNACDEMSFTAFGPLNKPLQREMKKHAKWHRRPKHGAWSSISKADRLRDYDWFWRIEPEVSNYRCLRSGTFR